ncbi:MAG: hypothetical protein CVT48_00485 [Thermoplasmata archaeon HGW-Thermoplasmata-1]|nr:MAG: hypothetical protein CVT48_00485 [Thermoplasmata archaeon HGW-Thermoplasmata-1]
MHHLRAKLWLEIDGEPVIGEGRAKLLETIEELGSLNKAAETLGMSYRHAWGIIKHMSEVLGDEIVVSARGGEGGGGTRLSDAGKALLSEFREKCDRIRHLVDE